jgi:hypothetical protein
MQSLIKILFIFAALAGQSMGIDYSYIGALPPVEVTAVRSVNEDVAWSGLMPAVEVTASRYENQDIAWCGMLPAVNIDAERYEYSIQDPLTDRRSVHMNAVLVKQTPTPNQAPSIPTADLKLYSMLPNALTFSGDYHLLANDTIDDDVTITGGNARIDGVISGDLAVMGGTVDIKGLVDGDVAVLGGNLELTGLIDGDAAVFGGNIKNRGTIDGELHVIGGTVYLDSGSVVSGDISMVGGTVERHDSAVVQGKIESVEFDALEKVLPRISRVFRFPRMLPGTAVFPRAVFLGMLVVLYLFNILVALIFPKAVDKIKEKIEQSVWASVGLGLALQVLLVPLIILLAVSIIGIPLIILLPLAVFLATLFGISALAMTVGERVCKGFNWNIQSQFGRLSLGWLAIMLIPIVVILIGQPVFVIGFIIVYVAMTIGLGGVIYALIRRTHRETKK